MGPCKDCRHMGHEAHHQFRDLRQCTLINEKAIPSVIELGTVLLESGDYASSDAKLWVDSNYFGCSLFEPLLVKLRLRPFGERTGIAGVLKDGTPVYYAGQPYPGGGLGRCPNVYAHCWRCELLEQHQGPHVFMVRGERVELPQVALIGVKRDPNAPEPRTARSWKEACELLGWRYTSDLRAEDENRERMPLIDVIQVADGDAASRLPCPCDRCGKEARYPNAFENRAGTEVYCGYECYRAAGGEA